MEKIANILNQEKDLTKEDTLQVVKYLQENPQDKETLSLFVQKNAPYIMERVKKFSTSLDFDDLIQEGFVGLLTAVQRYDFKYDTSFLTYATFYIDMEIREYIAKASFMIKIPKRVMTKVSGVQKAKDKMTEDSSLIDAAIECGMSKEEAVEINRVINLNDMHGLDSLQTEEEKYVRSHHSFSDQIKDPEDMVVSILTKEEILSAVETCLDEREKYIIISRYGLYEGEEVSASNLTQELNLSRRRIYQIEKDALYKLKKHLGDDFSCFSE